MQTVAPMVVFALLSTGVLLGQDKQKKLPSPPPDANPLPKVLEPARSPVERRDLVQQFHKRHALEGFYRLKTMVGRGSVQVAGSRGYLVVGQRHLSLHLYAPAGIGSANIQAAFRKFRIVGNKLIMNTLIGHRNKSNGDIALEPISFQTEHRFLLTGAVLRLYLGNDEYLEFERIE